MNVAPDVLLLIDQCFLPRFYSRRLRSRSRTSAHSMSFYCYNSGKARSFALSSKINVAEYWQCSGEYRRGRPGATGLRPLSIEAATADSIPRTRVAAE